MMAGLSELLKLVELFGEEGAFVIPVLLILGLIGAGDTFRRKPGTFCFFISVAFFVTWRVVFSFYQDGSSRYFQMPVILLGAGAVAGWIALFRWSRRISASNWIPVAIVLITVGICIGKSLNPPREKKFIASVAAYLQKQPEPGILFDSVAETERFRRLLPAWQFETGARESFQSPLFWRLFFDFFRTGQGAGKEIFY